MPDFIAVYLVLRDIDKVDELMADITEQQEVAQQISDAISRPVGFDVDEVIGARVREYWRKHETSRKECPRESWGKFGRGDSKMVCFWK